MGSGFKTFTAGSVLTASDVQNYLQDQAVMVFGGTAARSSAIGTANFEEGMLTYLTDVDKLQVYTGSSFQDVYPPAATSQGMTLINTTSFSGVASQSVNNVFSSTYDAYRIQVLFTSTAFTDGNLRLRMRVSGADDTTSNYYTQVTGFTDFNNTDNFRESNQTSFFVGATDAGNTGGQYHFKLDLFNPFVSSQTTNTGQSDTINGSAAVVLYNFGHLFNATTSFTGFTFFPSGGTMTGSVSTYGYNK